MAKRAHKRGSQGKPVAASEKSVEAYTNSPPEGKSPSGSSGVRVSEAIKLQWQFAIADVQKELLKNAPKEYQKFHTNPERSIRGLVDYVAAQVFKNGLPADCAALLYVRNILSCDAAPIWAVRAFGPKTERDPAIEQCKSLATFVGKMI